MKDEQKRQIIALRRKERGDVVQTVMLQSELWAVITTWMSKLPPTPVGKPCTYRNPITLKRLQRRA